MNDDPVKIIDYDLRWPILFEREYRVWIAIYIDELVAKSLYKNYLTQV